MFYLMTNSSKFIYGYIIIIKGRLIYGKRSPSERKPAAATSLGTLISRTAQYHSTSVVEH